MTKTFLYSHASRTMTEKAGMEEPDTDTPFNSRYREYEDHIKSLTTYPASGFNESHEGREMVEGEHFTFQCPIPTDIPCDCASIENCRQKRAIPLPQPSGQAGGDEIAEMDKAIKCLYLELPAAVADDVSKRWDAVKNIFIKVESHV